MLRTRVMPCLLLRGRGLVKTVRFEKPQYVGDPINTVRIFNEKEVDEIIFLDITATPQGKPPQFKLIEEIAAECFMPFAYGGGIRTLEDMKRILASGAEKLVINSYAMEKPDFITQAAELIGSQSIVVSIDARKTATGPYRVCTNGATRISELDPVAYARQAERLGAGEILVTSVDRDGTMEGYDIELIRQVSGAVRIPVIACGGAGTIEDFGRAVKAGGASAVACGSMVVYQGKNRSVLINFPTKMDLERVLA